MLFIPVEILQEGRDLKIFNKDFYGLGDMVSSVGRSVTWKGSGRSVTYKTR